MGVEIVGSVEQ